MLRGVKFAAKAWDAIAENYFDEISSPFEKGVKNPLFPFLEKLTKKDHLTVADIGCGPGNLLTFLAKRFKKVYAIDFSRAMLAAAKRAAPFDNVAFIKKDIRKLSSLQFEVDIAICVNSILVPSILDVDRSFAEIARTIRRGGRLVGIFPSMESVICDAMLMCERDLKKGMSQGRAIRHVRKEIEANSYIFETGHFQDSDMTQKFFYEFELRYRLKKAGFQGIRFQRVEYPPDDKNSKKKPSDKNPTPRLWDWFVVATKTRELQTSV